MRRFKNEVMKLYYYNIECLKIDCEAKKRKCHKMGYVFYKTRQKRRYNQSVIPF